MIELRNSGVEYNDSTHQYFYEGRELKGITGLLHNLVFPNMYKNVNSTTLAQAAAKGTLIHEEVELVASLGISPKLDCVKEFVNLLDAEGYEVIESEYVLRVGEDHASAIDLVMHKKGTPEDEVEIWDIKGTYSVNKEYVRWQNSMYKYGFENLNPELKVVRICCMWLRDDNKRGTICKLIPLGEARPTSDVLELFRCEKEGVLFDDDAKIPYFILDNEEALLDVQEKIARLKEQEDELKAVIFDGMSHNDMTSFKTAHYTYMLKDASERVSLDTKAFDADDEETYSMLLEKYKKVTKIKPTLALRKIG
jgi:hypothetical protein